MGLLEKFKQFKARRLEKKIHKNLKVLQNPKAIREDRVAAIEFFKALKDDQVAVPALLRRFEFSLEHGINDTREKESAMEGIVDRGDQVVQLVTQHLKQTTKIAWPIKVLESLVDKSMLGKCLFECLDFGEISLNQDKVDKNYDLLCYLREFELESPTELFVFMSAHDERLRFAASEALLTQRHEEIPRKLEPFLSDMSAENTRIRQTVTEAFVKNRWTVSDPGKLANMGLNEGLFINSENQLEMRS